MQPLNVNISQRVQGPASHIEITDLMQTTDLCFIYNLENGQIFKPVCDIYITFSLVKYSYCTETSFEL
jgi:hypothetical protein